MPTASQSGFTLIELIITAGILVLLSVGVISGYNNFNDTQKVQLAAKTLETNLRFAQAKAFSGQKPVCSPACVCTQLVGYDVVFTASQYTIQANCTNDSTVGGITTVVLPTGVTFSPVPTTLTFKVLTRGVDPPSVISLVGMGSSKIPSVTVGSNGDIIVQ